MCIHPITLNSPPMGREVNYLGEFYIRRILSNAHQSPLFPHFSRHLSIERPNAQESRKWI